MTIDDSGAGVSAAQSEAPEAAKPQFFNKSGAESLDKVRDILFGAQSREYEKRFARLEERLIKEAADLREDLRKRFDGLEAYVKQEIESLVRNLKAEHDQRTETHNDISRELKITSQSFERKTSQIDEQLSANTRALREQILEQSKNLSDEIREKHETMTAGVNRATAELRDEKTDRTASAALFMEVAMRLNNEFTIPRPEDLD